MSSVAFRLTIYQANGTTPDLTMTSIRSGTNPYIVGVPSGDGQEVDLLTGTVRSGAYNIEVADVVTGSDGTGTVRLVTNKLEDASFRQQLLSRRAKLEMSRNNGSTWSVWIFGYLTGLRQIDAITYGFTVSDSRRIESTHTAFTWSADTSAATDERREFPNRGCLIGGPTLQNFGPLRASGGWEYLWKEVQGSYLALSFVAAYNAPSFSRNPTMNVIGFFNALRPFFQSLPPVANLTGTNFEQIRERQYVFGFPAVMAIVTSGSSVWYGTVRAAHTPPAPGQNGQGQLALPSFGEMNYLYVELDPGQSTSYPSANAPVRVQLLQKEVSSASPLYINEHPVDIVSKLYETVNIPFDAASATTVKAIVGDDVRLALRVTEPVNLGQFLAQSIFGPFGFSARTNASGDQEFFATRIANSATPTITITDDDVVGDNPPPVFEVDESSVVTSFRLTAKNLSPFVADPTGSLQAPPDGLVEVETSQVVQNGDTSTYSTREVTYRFPGMVHDGSVSGAAFTLSPEVVGRFFTGIVAEGFDRFGRGAIASEVQVLSDASAASLQVGDEVLLGIGYYPNKNYRIGESSVGNRIAQIVRRTEAPEGPIFKLIDSGVNAQPTAPTFTLASFAGDPRREVAVTVTNAATLNTAQVTLAVQYQVSASTPTKTGTLYTRFRPGTIPTVAFTLPKVAPGSKVWVRMRTERTEYRASAWTAWTSQTLDAWIPPASLTVGTKTANSVALSWSLGSPTANTIDPLDVFAYKGASAPADWTGYRVGSLANGSTSITVRDLDASTQYTFGVAFRDEVSGAYSTFATATATTNAVNTVQAPNAPKMKVYTSFPDAGTTTGVALAIGAVEGYNIVVQRAADSSGSPGAWKEIALLAPLTPIFVDPLPSDGLTRWYRVFYRLSGFLDGTPGTARSATPIAIPDELVGQNASIISGGATLTFGNYLVGTPDSFYDGATSQSVAVDATPNATANKVVARDGSGNFAANTITATLNGPAPAGQLTGDTLAANVITSSLTTVGTIGTGTWQGTSVGKNYGGTGLTSSAFSGITNERVFAYDGASGAFFVAPSGSNGQALVYTAGALAWGNPAPGPHVLASTTGLGAEHTVSGLTSGMILQATGATTARFQTPSIPASSVTAGSFGGAAYTFTNDLTVSGVLTASLPYSSITGKPSYFPADLTSVNGTLGTANGGTANASWPAANSGEYVVIYDSVTGAERLEAGPQGSNGQALITSGGALTWGNPAPGSHVLATTTGLGAEHTVSGLTAGQILQATGATTARFQTPSIPASSVTAGTFSGTSYTITNDLTVSGTLTASLPFSSITGTPTTLAGYGITDALSNSTSSTQSGYFGDIFLWDDATPSHYLQITNSANLTAARTLSINVNDASRTVSLSGNLTISGNADISGTSSGTNTGDQTITLTGAVTGTGTGSFATTYAGTVPINKGGTNATSYGTTGTGTRALVYSITNGAFEAVAAGSSGQFLQSAGTTGDITWATPPTFTSSAAGYAPASGGGTSNFLRADGTWAVPSVGSVSANNVTAGTFSGATYTFSNSVTFSSGVRVANGETYKILNSGGTAIDVLSATTLGSGVINSSLTSVGTLTGLSVGGTASVTGTMTANRYAGVNSLTLNSYTTVNPSSNVYLYSPPNDRDAWVYLDSADTGSNWGIYHRQIDSTVSGLPANSIGFVGGGTSTLQAYISLANGNANFAGALTQAGNQVVHAGNVATYALPISGGTVTGVISVTASGGFSIGEDAGQNRIRTISGSRFAFYNSSDVLTGLAIRSMGVGATYGTIATPTNGVIIEGDVGIGTSAPGYKLSVAGTIHSSTGGFRFPDGTTQTTAATASQWTTSGSNIYYSGGNVGIGTSSPLNTLSVLGNVGVNGNTNSGGGTYMYDSYLDGGSSYYQIPQSRVRLDSSATGGIDEAPVAFFMHNENGTNNTWVKLSMGGREEPSAGNTVSWAGIAARKVGGTSGGWASGELHLWTKNGALQTDAVTITATGNVGIGTTSPARGLHVENGNYIRITGGAESTLELVMNTATAYIAHGGWSIGGNKVGIGDGSSPTMVVDNSSRNVGIGTTSPSFKLDVVGTVGTASAQRILSTSTNGSLVLQAGSGIDMKITGYNYSAGVGVPLYISVDGANTIMQANGGNVGIGTTSPARKLHVYGGASGGTPDTTFTQQIIENSGDAGLHVLNPDASIGRVMFGSPSRQYGGLIRWDFTGKNFDFATDVTGGFIRFLVGTFSEALRITSSGNVGIGTTNPERRLDVLGTSRFRAEAVSYNGTVQSLLIDGNGGNAALTINATSDYAYFNFAQAGTTKFEIGIEGAVTNKGSLYFNPNIQQGSSNAAIFIQKSNGHVGVGTVSPSSYARLHVGGSAKSLITSTSSSWGQFQVANPNDGESTIAIAAGGSGSPGNDSTYTRQWILGINPYGVGTDTFAVTNKTLTSSAPFSIKDTGDVLVNGTGWAGSRLQVNESSGPTAEINGTSNTAAQSPLYVWNNVESGSTYFISFYSDGQNNARTLRGYINYRRDIATMNLTTASDYRIKTVHGPYTKSGAIFDKLKVHEGTIHGETARVPMVLAHELQEAYEPAVEGEKDAVNEDGSPKLQMVSYVAMIPVMLAEIKSLRERVAQLEKMS